SSGDSPNRPLYVPVNFSPSCFNTTEGEPGPFGVSMVNFQLPVTFVDCAATVRAAAKMKAAVMIVMEAMMCLRIRFIVSPGDKFHVECGGSPTVREGLTTNIRPASRSGYRYKARRVEPVITSFDRTGHDRHVVAVRKFQILHFVAERLGFLGHFSATGDRNQSVFNARHDEDRRLAARFQRGLERRSQARAR